MGRVWLSDGQSSGPGRLEYRVTLEPAPDVDGEITQVWPREEVQHAP